jgi:hypothetical protein
MARGRGENPHCLHGALAVAFFDMDMGMDMGTGDITSVEKSWAHLSLREAKESDGCTEVGKGEQKGVKCVKARLLGCSAVKRGEGKGKSGTGRGDQPPHA